MQRQRGISQLEFAVVAVIFAVLVAFLLGRLGDVQEEAERSEVDLIVSNIRAGLRMAVDQRMARGQGDDPGALLNRNPVEFLGSPPRGYVDATGDTNGLGVWYFDSKTRILAYRTRHPEVFEGKAELRWRIVSQTGGADNAAGLELERAP